MKHIFQLFLILTALLIMIISSASAQGSLIATYNSGHIPTSYNAYDPTCNGPLAVLSITLPAGDSYEITGIEINYSMTADNTGYKSDQRSQLHCQNTNTTESQVYSGTGNTEGTYSYKRLNVDIANGIYPGGEVISFEMRAWRIFGSGPHCGPQFNQVDNNTWSIKIIHSAEIVIPKVGVSNPSPEQALDVDGKIKIGDDILSPSEGSMRYIDGSFEGYNGSSWNRFNGLNNGNQGTLMFSESPEDDNLIDLGYQLSGKTELYGSKSYLGMNEGTLTSVSVPGNIFGRYGHSAVWTGTEMLIWGGTNSNLNYPNNGFREVIKYNPSTNVWTVEPLGTGAPPNTRRGHSAIWTGTEMIIWGGRYSSGVSTSTYNNGYSYNPGTNSWTPLSQSGSIPSARYLHDAVWTGSEMIIYGGASAIGGKYILSSGVWTSLPIGPSAMNSNACVWTGTDMLVFGQGASTFGAKYNLASNSWTFPLPSNGPGFAGGSGLDAVWTGTNALVWGGSTNPAKYNPSTLDFPIIANEGPVYTSEGSAIWTGSEMIIFGGKYNDKPWNTEISSRQCYTISLTGESTTYSAGGFKTIYFYKK